MSVKIFAASVRIAAFAAPPVVACAHGPDPATLGATYRAALSDDDPARAWELMAPEARAATDRSTFNRRWEETRRERQALAASPPLEQAPEGAGAPATWLEGVTIHERGRRVTWTRVDGAFVATGGLGELPSRRSPLAALSAFARALRGLDMAALSDVVGPELARASTALLATRASGIEALLEDPSRITLVGDDQARALIEPGVLIRLQRFADGWRVVSVGD